ncbi:MULTISPECIES: sensor histidine kinase [Subtercola]|nr:MULTISPECIES: sensor histidine kinase [Subtercola]MEA9985165.1 sensor histidine kinase [Subtercola sp. RTI3]
MARTNPQRGAPGGAEFDRQASRFGGHAGPPTLLFVLLPVFFSFLVQVPVAVLSGVHRHDPLGLLTLVLALIGPGALLFARRFPGPVVAIVAAAACADLLLPSASGAPYVAVGFAVISAIARGARLWAFLAVTAGWLIAFGGSLVFSIDWNPGRVVVTTIGLVVAMVIGEGIRTRRQRVLEFQLAMRRRREDTAQAERVRIARELHDVLAHSLSQINVQAGVGLHLIDEHPEKAAEALANIKLTSKTALDEVRGVLGFLRSERDAPLLPSADLARLESLVAGASTEALRVRLDNRITSAPSAGVQLALFRIAQESLTNATRHSGASEVAVTVAETAGFYSVTIEDNGVAAPAGASTTTLESALGNGIRGMRERAELLGGTFEVGPVDAAGSASSSDSFDSSDSAAAAGAPLHAAAGGLAGPVGFRVRAILPKQGSGR